MTSTNLLKYHKLGQFAMCPRAMKVINSAQLNYQIILTESGLFLKLKISILCLMDTKKFNKVFHYKCLPRLLFLPIYVLFFEQHTMFKLFITSLCFVIVVASSGKNVTDNGRHSPLIDPTLLPHVSPRPVNERITYCGQGVYALSVPFPRFQMARALKDPHRPLPPGDGLWECTVYWPPCKFTLSVKKLQK